jgi:hypothetical protein
VLKVTFSRQQCPKQGSRVRGHHGHVASALTIAYFGHITPDTTQPLPVGGTRPLCWGHLLYVSAECFPDLQIHVTLGTCGLTCLTGQGGWTLIVAVNSLEVTFNPEGSSGWAGLGGSQASPWVCSQPPWRAIGSSTLLGGHQRP